MKYSNPAWDINMMHEKFGVHEWMDKATYSEKQAFMKFRMNFLTEEFKETTNAYRDGDIEELIDGHIDLMVIALGTLDAFGVDFSKAWNEVMQANMSKEKGIKPSRPNPLGMPDMIKPEGWVGPDHEQNYGEIDSHVITDPDLIYNS